MSGTYRKVWTVISLISPLYMINEFGIQPYYDASVIPKGSMGFSPKYPKRGMLDEGLHFRMPFEEFVRVQKNVVNYGPAFRLKDKITGETVLVSADQLALIMVDAAKYHETCKNLPEEQYFYNVDLKNLTDAEVHAICTSPTKEALEATADAALTRLLSQYGFRGKVTGASVWKATQF